MVWSKAVAWVVACVGVAGVAGGCAATNVQRPTATFQSVNLGEVTPDGFRMNFVMNVDNPNSVALPVSTADYQLGVAGVRVISDETTLDKGLAANSTTPVTVPVMVRFDDLLKARTALVKSGGDVPFEFSGNLQFRGMGWLPGQDVKVPLQYKGTLPLKRVLSDPEALLQSPAARELAQQILGGVFGR